jgi:hypothetical protein
MPATKTRSTTKSTNDVSSGATMSTDRPTTEDKIFSELKLINQKLEKLDSIDQRLTLIENTVQGLVRSQEFLSSQFDEQEKDIVAMKSNMKLLQVKNKELSQTLFNAVKNVEKNEKKFNDLEQYGRREMVEVQGVTRMANENTDSIIMVLAKLFKLNITIYDIEVSHRLSNRQNSPIIVKFNNRRLRDIFFRSARTVKPKLCDINYEGETKIFVNESLSQVNRKIFYTSRERLKPSYRYVWTKNGSTFIRLNDQSKSMKVESLSDLDRISAPVYEVDDVNENDTGNNVKNNQTGNDVDKNETGNRSKTYVTGNLNSNDD